MAFTQISTDGIKNGTITGSDLATNIDLTDSQKIRFGNSQDLQLFHDGNNSVITAGGAGDLQLTSTFDDVIIQAADNIFINPQGGETGIQVYGDGNVKLYHANSQKFRTYAAGVEVTGNVLIPFDGTSTTNALRIGASQDLTIFHDGSSNKIIAANHDLIVQSDGYAIRSENGSSTFATIDSSGRVGIGTSSPTVALDIEATTPTIRLTDSDASGTPECEIKGGGGDLVLSADRDDEKSGTKIQFQTDGSTKITIDEVGRLGVGTTSPSSFNVFANTLVAATSTNTGLTLSGNDASTNYSGLQFAAGTTVRGYLDQQLNSTGRMQLMNIANGHLGFGTNNQVRMTIDSSGRVLTGGATSINGSTNADDLQIGASGQANQTGISLGSAVASSLRFMDVANDSAGSILYNHGTDDMSISATNSVTLSEAGTVRFSTHSNGVIISGFTDVRQDSTSTYSQTAAPGNLLARFYNGSAQSDSMASIQLRASNDNGAADLWYITCVAQAQNYNGFLAFSTRTTSTAYQEQVRFANNGEVTMLKLKLGSGNDHEGSKLVIQGSGNASSTKAVYFKNSDETPLFVLRNDGAFFTGTDGLSPYNLTTSSPVNCFISSDGTLRRSTSSIRYKKDIADATWGLADVLKLKPKTFKNNATGEFADDKTYAGFTAEDIHDLGLTEFVQYNEDNEPDALAYGNMVALMAKAIQDLNAKVEALEAG